LNHLTVPFAFTTILLSSTATHSCVVGLKTRLAKHMMTRNRQEEE
jgi:hypothetical protein